MPKGGNQSLTYSFNRAVANSGVTPLCPGEPATASCNIDIMMSWRYGQIIMRTTITLDRDVAERVQVHMREQKKGFKEAINDLIRRGLAFPEESLLPKSQVIIKARDLELKAGLSSHNIEDLLDQVEGPLRP